MSAHYLLKKNKEDRSREFSMPIIVITKREKLKLLKEYMI